jgi:hypothetical protein
MRAGRSESAQSEQGTALVMALMTVTLLAVLAGGLLTTAVTEMKIAAVHRDGVQALYAVEAVTELILAELTAVADVDDVLTGATKSSFVDGDGRGQRQVGAVTLDLLTQTSVERCGDAAGCGAAPAGNIAWWQLYAHGWLHEATAWRVRPPVYVIAWVGDDPAENDGNPMADGAPAINPGSGIVALRVHAYGAAGAVRRANALIGGLPDRPCLLSWKEG